MDSPPIPAPGNELDLLQCLSRNIWNPNEPSTLGQIQHMLQHQHSQIQQQRQIPRQFQLQVQNLEQNLELQRLSEQRHLFEQPQSLHFDQQQQHHTQRIIQPPDHFQWQMKINQQRAPQSVQQEPYLHQLTAHISAPHQHQQPPPPPTLQNIHDFNHHQQDLQQQQLQQQQRFQIDDQLRIQQTSQGHDQSQVPSSQQSQMGDNHSFAEQQDIVNEIENQALRNRERMLRRKRSQSSHGFEVFGGVCVDECSNQITGEGTTDNLNSAQDAEVADFLYHCHWDSCDLAFHSIPDLSDHFMMKHIDDFMRWEDCHWEDCDASLSGNRDGKVDHVRMQHMSKSEHHQCLWTTRPDSLCSLCFPTAKDLSEHLSSSHLGSGKSQYICMWHGCPREHRPFSQKQKALRHLHSHTKYQPWKCSVCKMAFSEKQNLLQHERTHTGEKPYKCSYCGKRFSAGTALSIHIRTHTGVKPFICMFPGCNKRFSESSNLAKHIKGHLRRQRDGVSGEYNIEHWRMYSARETVKNPQ